MAQFCVEEALIAVIGLQDARSDPAEFDEAPSEDADPLARAQTRAFEIAQAQAQAGMA